MSSSPTSAGPPVGPPAGREAAGVTARRDRPAVTGVKYALFAGLAIGCNLGTQRLMDAGYQGRYSVYASLFVGTVVGLVVKYALDKRFVFYDSTAGVFRRGIQFFRYALTGVLTTAIFWGLELGAYAAMHTGTARYVGGAVGLALGYWIKYRLDKRLVFRNPAATSPGRML